MSGSNRFRAAAISLLVVFTLLISACGTAAPAATPAPQEPAELKGLTDAQKAWAKTAELGPYAPKTQDWAAIEAAAKKEGKVVIYSNSSRWPDIKKTFEAAYPGVVVEGYDISTVDLITKLQKEQKAGIFTADVILCGDYATLVTEMLNAPNKMLWNFVPDVNAAKIAAAAKEPLMYHRYGLTVFGYNTEVYKEPPIKNIWEITKPEWKGRIVLPDPQKVAMSLLALTLITKNSDVMAKEYEKVFGKPIVLEKGVPNAGYQWIKDVLKNEPALTSSSGDAATAIGTKGQKNPPVGFTTYSKIRNAINGEIAFDAMWNMAPIIGFTEETALAIANQATHPNAAKLLIRWMQGDEKGGGGFTPFYVPGDYSTRRTFPRPRARSNGPKCRTWFGAAPATLPSATRTPCPSATSGSPTWPRSRPDRETLTGRAGRRHAPRPAFCPAKP